MIPLRDIIPSRTTPVVTISIIALNVLVFVYELSLGRAVDAFTLYYGLVPAAFSWTNVFTSMFLHGSFLHVAGNMLYLWIFGDNVEDRMGHGRFLVFYLLCGVAAALAQTVTAPESAILVLTTLLPPTSGTARVGGFDVVHQGAQVRASIGAALQEAALDPILTAGDLLPGGLVPDAVCQRRRLICERGTNCGDWRDCVLGSRGGICRRHYRCRPVQATGAPARRMVARRVTSLTTPDDLQQQTLRRLE